MITTQQILQTQAAPTTTNQQPQQQQQTAQPKSQRVKFSEHELIEGVARYIESEIIPSVTDVPFQILLYFGVRLLRKDRGSQLFKMATENPIVSMFLSPDADNLYDITDLVDTAKESIQHYGKLSIRIPPIKFLSPEEKVLNFTSSDIDTLVDYISMKTA